MSSTSIIARTFNRPGRRARLATVALLGFAPLTNCMCANAQRSRAYRRHLHRSIDDYTHHGSRVKVAEDARRIVTERGHTLGAWDGHDPVVTEWETNGDFRMRHRLELLDRRDGHAVRLTEEVQRKAAPTWVRESHHRDHDVEAAVLERIHPGRGHAKSPSEVGDYLYDVAPSVLWDAAREELMGRGALLQSYDVPLDVTAATLWVVYDGDEPARVRHEVSIVRQSDQAHRLEVYRTKDRGEGPRPWRTASEQRDHDLELALIRRRDAAAAEAMEEEAEREGQEAYERALDAGAVACGR